MTETCHSPSESKRSTTCEPMNPAPPVIKMLCIDLSLCFVLCTLFLCAFMNSRTLVLKEPGSKHKVQSLLGCINPEMPAPARSQPRLHRPRQHVSDHRQPALIEKVGLQS